jgi:hypothetical protein
MKAISCNNLKNHDITFNILNNEETIDFLILTNKD